MKYYVYTLARPDSTVFYVGKGSGKRITQHEQEALRGCPCEKCAMIRELWQQGATVQRTIVLHTDNEQAALAHEAELIRAYGRETLVNRSAGQDGRRSETPKHVPPPTIQPLPRDPTVAELVDRLFTTHRHPSGREYTYFEVSLLMEGAIQPPHLHALRRGNSTNPTRKTLLARCQFFGVPAAYFFPELAGPAQDTDDAPDLALLPE